MTSESPTWRFRSNPLELDQQNELYAHRLTRQIEQLQAELSSLPVSSHRRYHHQVEPDSSQPVMLMEAMRLENAQLRNRVADLERDLVRVSRINDVYRQELLEHRRRLGIPYESLIGMAASASHSVASSPTDTFGPYQRRAPSTSSSNAVPGRSSSSHTPAAQTRAVPIPRIQSQTRIHTEPETGDSSPSYSLSPTAPLASSSFFPSTGSHMTTLTTPPESEPTPTPPPQPASTGLALALTELAQRAALSYPSVPPPSLASSLGSVASPIVPTLRVPPNSRRQSGAAAERPPGLWAGRRDEELEGIGEDDDGIIDEDDDYAFGGLEIGRGRGRGIGLGLTGT